MGGPYLKAYRAMASGKDDFIYGSDLDAILAIIDANMFENDEDMESEIVTCIKNLPSRARVSRLSFILMTMTWRTIQNLFLVFWGAALTSRNMTVYLFYMVQQKTKFKYILGI